MLHDFMVEYGEIVYVLPIHATPTFTTYGAEEVRQGQKVINEMITCLYKPNEIIPEAFSPLYPRAFIMVINSLDSPDNMLTNNALYP